MLNCWLDLRNKTRLGIDIDKLSVYYKKISTRNKVIRYLANFVRTGIKNRHT